MNGSVYAIIGYLPSEGQKTERTSFSGIYGNSNWRSWSQPKVMRIWADYLQGFALQRHMFTAVWL